MLNLLIEQQQVQSIEDAIREEREFLSQMSMIWKRADKIQKNQLRDMVKTLSQHKEKVREIA